MPIAGYLRSALKVLLVVAALAYASYSGMDWKPVQKPDAPPASAAKPDDTKAAPQSGVPDTSPHDVIPAPPAPEKSGGAFFRPGGDPHEDWWLTHWVWLVLFGLLVVATALLGWLMQSRKAENMKLLGEAAKRLRVWLIGPVPTEDSRHFAEALNIWHEVIVNRNPTPRTIKAFLNRLRYFASRMGESLDDKRQAHLVALSAVHYAFTDPAWALERMGKNKTDLEAEIHDYQWPAMAEKNGEPTKQHMQEQLFLRVLLKHHDFFGALPDENDRKLFQELVADIEIHKQE